MRLMTAVIMASATSVSAAPTTWEWNWAGNGFVGNRGGTMQSITARYDSVAQRFSWDVTYSDQITDGYTLAVNDGGLPRGVVGEFGLLYFDATGPDIEVSVFEYNGENNSSSHATPGNFIVSSDSDPGFVISASKTDHANGTRTFNLEIDTSVIEAYPSATTDPEWHGIGFDDRIGLWFHSFKDLTTGYGTDGVLNAWNGLDGFLDLAYEGTTPIPLPTSGALAVVGLGLIGARRRRAS